MQFGRVHSIPAQHSFVDTLADALLADFGDDPLRLSEVLVLLPTRRAARSLREAFLRRTNGAAMLLPTMRPIGDVDEDELILYAAGDEGPGSGTTLDLPPAAPELHRRLTLARLIATVGAAFGHPAPEHCLRLAAELAHLIDQVHTENLSFDALDTLVPDAFAENWRQTLTFLQIIRETWPSILEADGVIDPGDRRNRLILAQAQAWRDKPPAHPIIAAGSTGSIPATAVLLGSVLSAPQGAVILPGLDRDLDEEAWEEAGRDETHPQYGLCVLLRKLKTARESVIDLTGPMPPNPNRRARIQLLAQALRPAVTTDAWRGLDAVAPAALKGVSLVAAPTQQAEAATIALIMREALETPSRRCALVTPDRVLARRVAASLQRWGIEVDDSAGAPLESTQAAIFCRLILDAVRKALAPTALLALLKHPLTWRDAEIGRFRNEIRMLERAALRGVKPAPGAAGLKAAIEDSATLRDGRTTADQRARLNDLVDWAADLLAPLIALYDGTRRPTRAFAEAHISAAEGLAGGAERLWRGEAGENLAGLVAELTDAPAAGAFEITGADYAGVFAALLAGRVVRPRYGAHPRLAIWGPLEARLQQADLVILGGLNEGVWPPEARTDAWMSRPMRKDFGLPAPERRIGLSAHDFQQGFGAPDLVLTRSEKIDGAPTAPSRWLSRLLALLNAEARAALTPPRPWRDWATAIDRAAPGDGRPAVRPAPRPPVAARPNKLSVTRIETLLRDPYGVYAEYVLRLRRLDPLEAAPGPADRGNVVHAALESFIGAFPSGPLPRDGAARLEAFGRDAFGRLLDEPTVRAFWLPRFRRIADWFLHEETIRREWLEQSWVEADGRYSFETLVGEFTIFGKADRIDRLSDGGYALIDYKTGQPPPNKEVQSGLAPQLPLLAAILAEGGFEDCPPGAVRSFAFWRLSGGDPAGSIHEASAGKGLSADALAAFQLERLKGLIEAYSHVETPYLATPKLTNRPAYSDYEHLSRIAEWGET
ncbi:MAG: double-strand break repair protein AddB [Alphaproteobacteria bacterium]|nr:double-strand break repair protein AddB [Alphaproteobacteria bacterium]